METHTIVTNYGECRCCLAKGNHRDITNEYYFNGIREVFLDIFMECFNLFLSTNSHLSTLICSSCVARLRDACNFRMMVVGTEQQLLSTLAESDADDKQIVFVKTPAQDIEVSKVTDIKLEPETTVKDEPDDRLQYEFVYTSDDDHDEEINTVPKREQCYVEGEEELLARFDPDSLNPLPTRETLYETCPTYVKHLDLLKGKVVTPSMLEKLLINGGRKRKKLSSYKTKVAEKAGHIVNINALLRFSNVTPFKSGVRAAGFSCFYCQSVFENFGRLREHTSGHEKAEIEKKLGAYMLSHLVVNADITDLQCSVCHQSLSNLNEFKSHLTDAHKMKLHPELQDRLIPFKLTSQTHECQVCGCRFQTFGAMECHMNVHYRNFVCKECGVGFVTANRLKVHRYNSHVSGRFPCQQCGKMFKAKTKLVTHFNAVHRMMRRFKCTKCPEGFKSYPDRQKHYVQVHGAAPVEYRCNVCERSFDRQYALSRHTKRDHLEERDYQCDVCDYRCFARHQLELHAVKHSGARKFACSVCERTYAHKKSMTDHMKTHSNERRFACAACGQAFAKRSTLEGHMKSRHLDCIVQKEK